MKQRTFLSATLLSLSALMVGGLAVFLTQDIRANQSPLKIYKFEADWCGPCQRMKPIFKKVSGKFKDVSFQTINVDKEPNNADRFGVSILPTIVAVKDGEIVGRTTGYKNAVQLKLFIQKHNR